MNIQDIAHIKTLIMKIIYEHPDRLNKGWPKTLIDSIDFLNYYISFAPDDNWRIKFRDEHEIEECLSKSPEILEKLKVLYSNTVSGQEIYTEEELCQESVKS